MSRWPGALAGLCVFLVVSTVWPQGMSDYISAGDRHFHAGDYAAAEREFKAAAEAFPDQPIPRLARGHALFALRDYAAASRSLQDGIGLIPAWHGSGINLRGFVADPGAFDANLLDLAGRYQAAPHDRHLLFLLAYCPHFSGRPAEAQALFEELLALASDHAAARTFLDDTAL